jgi:hypothetical protein
LIRDLCSIYIFLDILTAFTARQGNIGGKQTSEQVVTTDWLPSEVDQGENHSTALLWHGFWEMNE